MNVFKSSFVHDVRSTTSIPKHLFKIVEKTRSIRMIVVTIEEVSKCFYALLMNLFYVLESSDCMIMNTGIKEMWRVNKQNLVNTIATDSTPWCAVCIDLQLVPKNLFFKIF